MLRELSFERERDWVLEDNYFDLNNETRRVKILNGCADSVKVRSIYDIR